MFYQKTIELYNKNKKLFNLLFENKDLFYLFEKYNFIEVNPDNNFIIKDYFKFINKKKREEVVVFPKLFPLEQKYTYSPFKYFNIIYSRFIGGYTVDRLLEQIIIFCNEYRDIDLSIYFVYARVSLHSYLDFLGLNPLFDIINLLIRIDHPDRIHTILFHTYSLNALVEVSLNNKEKIKPKPPLQKLVDLLLITSKISKTIENKNNLYNIITNFSGYQYLLIGKIKNLLNKGFKENLYKVGINVHNENRDFKTDLILTEFLRISQGVDIDKYFKKFVKHSKKLSQKKQDELDKILHGKNRSNTEFGGLLEGNIKIGGDLITGKELISKFWWFALNYKPPCKNPPCEEFFQKEKENLKVSVFNSLLNSLQESGNGKYVVCNPGKLQRLAISTLQGRIKDQNGNIMMIDTLEKKDEVQTTLISNYDDIKKYLRPFIQTYLYEEETRITNWKKLILKVFKYIKRLEEEGTAEFGRVNLDYSNVIYYLCMMAETQNGLEIIPDLSIMSLYDIDLTSDYSEYFLEEDLKMFKKANHK